MRQMVGFNSVQWNAINNQGEPISAGVYIYSIEADNFIQTRKDDSFKIIIQKVF